MAVSYPGIRETVACASGILYWAGVTVQIARVKRRAGRSPNVKPRGLKERMLWLAWITVIAVWIGQPIIMESLPDMPLLRTAAGPSALWSLAAGLMFVVMGQAGTYWCYAALGDSWRIGVKKREKTALITIGPYRFVRHPIYAFQSVILMGVVILLPTPLSLAILILQLACSYIKAFDEEAYLNGVHGESYARYMSATGRFLPRLVKPSAGGQS